MQARLLLASALLIAASRPSEAGTITDLGAQLQLPSGLDFVIGMYATNTNQLWMVSLTADFKSPLFGDPQGVGFSVVGFFPPEMKLYTGSRTALTYLDGDAVIVATGVRGLTHEYDLKNQELIFTYARGLPPSAGITFLKGVEYSIDSTHLFTSIDPSTGVITKLANVDNSLRDEVALATGPDNIVYTVGRAVGTEGACSDSQICVAGLDPASGAVISGFPVLSDTVPEAITIGSDGTIYLAYGDGQGSVYGPNGMLLNTLTSTTVDKVVNGALTQLTLDNNGYLYMEDYNTGLHVFDVNVNSPEPGGPLPFAMTLFVSYTAWRWKTRARRR